MADSPHKPIPQPASRGSDYSSLLDRLEQVLQDCKAQASAFALLVIDLSRITTVIPVLGYRQTEQVLSAIESRLSAIKRPVDILVRIADFRFALIIPNLKFSSMAELAANRVMESMHGLHEFTGLDTTINPATGIALYPAHAGSAEDLLMEAEIATQIALEQNRHALLAGGDSNRQIHVNRKLAVDLESAFRKSELELHYQPQVHLASGKVHGVEALIRWQHPEHGQVRPDILVPIIENSPLVGEITLWILNTALHQSSAMRRLFPDYRVAVNLTPALLHDPDLVDLVERSLRIWNTRPEHLVLEVTETSMMDDMDASLDTLRRLNELGVQLSIDDFGTGYSSFSYLQQLPVHELKIDRSFITDMLSGGSRHVVSTIIKLGQEFGMNVLAEGIETDAVYQQLVAMGCRYGQGYYISRPMPFDIVLSWLKLVAARTSVPG